MPKVSVIMPTYNNENTVGNAIESILNQSFEDWELLIVDDASSDSTGQVVGTFTEDPRITLTVLNQNLGSGVARNVALRGAVGEYIAVMDADDISLPRRLETQVSAMEADKDIAVLATQVAEFGEWGGPLEGRWPTSDAEVVARQKAMKMPIPHPSAMFRATEIRRVGGYDERCRRAQDFALLLKLSDRRVRCLSEVLVHYRTNRPVPLEYVLRNGRYADLARRRFELARDGVDEALLPLDPEKSLRTDMGSFKSWIARNLQEKVGR